MKNEDISVKTEYGIGDETLGEVKHEIERPSDIPPDWKPKKTDREKAKRSSWEEAKKKEYKHVTSGVEYFQERNISSTETTGGATYPFMKNVDIGQITYGPSTKEEKFPGVARAKHKRIIEGFSAIKGEVQEMRKVCGFTGESSVVRCMLMLEEMGELARAIRKAEKVKHHDDGYKNNIGEELADVFIYVSSIADIYNIDLAEAVLDKIEVNKNRTWK